MSHVCRSRREENSGLSHSKYFGVLGTPRRDGFCPVAAVAFPSDDAADGRRVLQSGSVEHQRCRDDREAASSPGGEDVPAGPQPIRPEALLRVQPSVCVKGLPG